MQLAREQVAALNKPMGPIVKAGPPQQYLRSRRLSLQKGRVTVSNGEGDDDCDLFRSARRTCGPQLDWVSERCFHVNPLAHLLLSVRSSYAHRTGIVEPPSSLVRAPDWSLASRSLQTSKSSKAMRSLTGANRR
jgi:hypothetical protein